MIWAGIGCTRACAAKDVLQALALALTAAGRELREVQALGVPDWKREADALCEAAQALAKPLIALPRAALRAQAARTLTRSERSLAHAGVPSVAETAALAAAFATNGRARLLGPRVIWGGATCALANTEEIP